MSPRLTLRTTATPLVMAGALWATGALAPLALGGGAQTPPPCGPDGICMPRVETYGFHTTRWRSFPGDSIGKTPTTAATKEPSKEELTGPKLPGAAEEGQLGPAKAPRAGGAPGEEPAAEDAAAAGLGTLPGEVPLPGMELPGLGQPAPGAEGGAAPTDGPAPGPETNPQTVPGAEPGANPLDPFGAAPPAPPAWLESAALQNRAPGGEAGLDTLPMVAMDGPNLHGDDAPPMLPPALRGGIAVAPAQAPGVAPKLVQPASVSAPIVDDRVTKASVMQPVGIQLVNPAAAMVDPEAEGLQQAIYFEVSDQ